MEMKYWYNGLPAEGVDIAANDSGTCKYWFNGLPNEYIITGSGTSTSPSSSISPSVSLSRSISPSVSISRSISPSVSMSRSISPSVSISWSISPSVSISRSISPSVSLSRSISPSASISPSVSISRSISPSISISRSISPSISISPSVSISKSISPSVSISWSISPSVSISRSISPSVSISRSISPSASISPSVSISRSISPSASESPSPSAGYQEYTRGDYADLPSNSNNLTVPYSEQDYLDVEEKDEARVSQSTTGQNAIHQFKDFVGSATECNIEWFGQTNVGCNNSTMNLQVYNITSGEWDTVAFDETSVQDLDFSLIKTGLSLTNYTAPNKTITWRVYQLSI